MRRRERNTFMSSRFESLYNFPDRPRDGRLGFDHAVVDDETDLEFLACRHRAEFRPPGHGNDLRINLPRLRGRQGLHICFDVGETAGDRASDGANYILPGSTDKKSISIVCNRTKKSQGQVIFLYPLRSYGCRPEVGDKPYSPHSPAGMRTEPPISEPIPKTLPRAATSADSPPLLPPEIRPRLSGLRHCPKTWL
jgi:hypothetical protein